MHFVNISRRNPNEHIEHISPGSGLIDSDCFADRL